MKTTENNFSKLEPLKVYSLFNASGKIEEIKPVPALPMYCKVFIYGFAMSESRGAVISGPNQYGIYKVVKISDYEPGFSQLDSHSRPISKKFGIGVYFDDHLSTWPEETVKKYIVLAEAAEKKAKEEAEAKATADEKERAELPGLYPHMTPNPGDDQTITKNNLVAELKKHFAGVKFSVRKDHYDTYSVRWQNGPTEEQVTKLTGKFEDHETDFTGDFRDYAPSNFNKVFGGFEYVFETRNITEEVYSILLPELRNKLSNEERDADNILYRILRKTELPQGNIRNLRIERTDVTCGQIEDFYKIAYDVEETSSQAPEKAETVDFEGLHLVEYSEKALALFGDTKPIKAALKELGGRFNAYLTHDGEKVPGWVFSKSKRSELETLLNQ